MVTDLVSLLTTARSAGLDIGSLVSLITIYFMLKSFVTKQNEELKRVVNVQVDKIVRAIDHHNERLESLEIDVREIKKKFN